MFFFVVLYCLARQHQTPAQLQRKSLPLYRFLGGQSEQMKHEGNMRPHFVELMSPGEVRKSSPLFWPLLIRPLFH